MMWEYITIIDKNEQIAKSYDLKDGKLVICEFSEFVNWGEYDG